MSTTTNTSAAPAQPSGGKPPGRKKYSKLTRQDRWVLAAMIGVPTVVHVALVWVPALLSVLLSFTRWDGIGGLGTIEFVGLDNYVNIFTNYPPFWPAVAHNIIWLVFFLVVPTTLGLLLAYLIDKELRGSAFYQSAIYLPVVLSGAIVGFVWTLIYSNDQGMINEFIRATVDPDFSYDWLGTPKVNLIAALIAASWRQIGYIMILYLAGLKSVDPSLREAAALDGANEWQTFRRVVFPSLAPINIVVLVVSIIDSLRAFDLVYILNGGRNGLELLGVLVIDNIVGEASRIGFGSALAVVLLVIAMAVILPYLFRVFREDVRSR